MDNPLPSWFYVSQWLVNWGDSLRHNVERPMKSQITLRRKDYVMARATDKPIFIIFTMCCFQNVKTLIQEAVVLLLWYGNVAKCLKKIFLQYISMVLTVTHDKMEFYREAFCWFRFQCPAFIWYLSGVPKKLIFLYRLGISALIFLASWNLKLLNFCFVWMFHFVFNWKKWQILHKYSNFDFIFQ